MAADICDMACCENCRGDVVAFDVDQSLWHEIVDQGGGHVSVAYRSVPCPVKGNIKAYFTEGYQGANYFRLVVYNHRIGVDSIEVKGSASGATGGTYTPLHRTVDNYFDWTAQADVGFPITLRVKSTQGQYVQFAELNSITAEQRITASSQFDDINPAGASCAWPGPQTTIFTDTFGGILGLMWRDWGSYQLANGDVDYGFATNCHSGSVCIRVGPMNAWGAVQIGYPNTFPPSMIQSISFWARTESGTADTLSFFYNGVDTNGDPASGDKVSLGTITTDWQHFSIDFAPHVANVARMQVVRVSNESNDPTPGIVLDDIELVE
jgi:hypothetical protein